MISIQPKLNTFFFIIKERGIFCVIIFFKRENKNKLFYVQLKWKPPW